MINLEKEIHEAKIALAEIKTGLEFIKELRIEQRVRKLENIQSRMIGYTTGVAALIAVIIEAAARLL
jgi:hypothetical protein